MDGSAFESTQHASLMRIVDDRVYRMFHELLTKHLPENLFFQRHLQDIPTFLDTWLADATDHVNVMFICLPGINGAKWPEDIIKIFN